MATSEAWWRLFFLGLSCASHSGLACCMFSFECLQRDLCPDAVMNGSRLRLAMAPSSSATLRPAHMPPRTMLAQAVSIQPSTTNDLSGGALGGNLVAVVCLNHAACCVA